MRYMNEVYLLEWTFTPSDYFEEAVDFPCRHGSFRISGGKAKLDILPNEYPSDHSLRMQLHRELNALFLAVQVLTHMPYKLTYPTVSKLYPDGRKDIYFYPKEVTLAISCECGDFTIKDGAGNIVRDTKQERIIRRDRFAQRVAQHINNPVANALLRSYSAAVNDPQNEMVHLYEIRDALSQHFHGETAATTSIIGISRAQWSRIGQLANDVPLSQGRHRGKKHGALRKATSQELTEARQIACLMIDGYLQYLEAEPSEQTQHQDLV